MPLWGKKKPEAVSQSQASKPNPEHYVFSVGPVDQALMADVVLTSTDEQFLLSPDVRSVVEESGRSLVEGMTPDQIRANASRMVFDLSRRIQTALKGGVGEKVSFQVVDFRIVE